MNNIDLFFIIILVLVLFGTPFALWWKDREPRSKPAPAKVCDSCGTELPTIARFCRRCGKPQGKYRVDFGNKRNRHTQWAAMADALNLISVKSSGETICVKDGKIIAPPVTKRPKSMCLAPLGCDCSDCIEKRGPIRPNLIGKDLRTRIIDAIAQEA